MKRLLLVLFCLAFPLAASAIDNATPVKTVHSLIAEMKKQGGFRGMLAHVHWPTALQGMAPDEKAAMGVTSPEDLQRVTLKFLEDPAKALYERMAPRMKDMEESTRQLTEEFVKKQQERLEKKLAAIERRMVHSEYEVGEAAIDGNTALVDLVSTYEGERKERKIRLIRIDDAWYLPTGDLGAVEGAQVSAQGVK